MRHTGIVNGMIVNRVTVFLGSLAPLVLPAAFILAVLLLLAPSASAALPIHVHNKALDVSGLNHACGVAVDSKGDLYASSAGESKIQVYDSSHSLLTSIEDTHEPCGL